MTMATENPFCKAEKARFVRVLNLAVERVEAVVVLAVNTVMISQPNEIKSGLTPDIRKLAIKWLIECQKRSQPSPLVNPKPSRLRG